MEAEKFMDKVFEKSQKEYGIFPPPTEAQDGLNVLIEHFLGKDWHSINPINQEQINTEAIYEILEKYPKKKSLLDFCKILLDSILPKI